LFPFPILALFLALLACAGTAEAGTRGNEAGKLDLAVRHAIAHPTGQATVRVIVKRHGGETAALTSRLQTHGARIVAEHALVASVSAELDRDALAALAADPGIAHVSLDATVRAAAVVDRSDTGLVSDALLQTLGVSAPRGAGLGVGVAVIDSGVQVGPDLNLHASFDFTGGRVRHGGFDGYGHGTHVAGLIGAGGSAPGMRGVAPGVRLISLKVLDNNGEGLTSTVIQALEFAVANRRRLGIDIINLSLGHPSSEPAATDPLVQAVETASRAGLIVVVAAGNRGVSPTGGVAYAGIVSPANAPSAITVGSLDTKQTVSRQDDEVAAYSSRGPTLFDRFAKPDIVAPGHRLLSVAAFGSWLWEQYPSERIDDAQGRPRYLRLSGTSMAAGVVSGAVARLIDTHRAVSETALTPNHVKAMLQYTSVAITAEHRLVQGAGALNLGGALSLVEGGSTAASGTSSGVSIPAPYTSIGTATYVWSQTIVWGNAIVWGNSLSPDEFAWSADVVWGSAIVWGNEMIVRQGSDLLDDSPQSWEANALAGTTADEAQDATGSIADVIVWGNRAGGPVWSTAAGL
jgi:serine protease AprX